MTAKTRAQLKAENAADFPDNTARLISPASLRGQMDDVADSAILTEDLPALGLTNVVTTVPGNSYTLTEADNGALLYFTSPELTAVIIPNDLPVSFTCRLVQIGEQITLIPAVGVTLASANTKFSSVRYVILELVAISANSYLLFGETVDRKLPPEQENSPTNTVLPSIIQSGFILTANPGIWTGAPREYHFAWYRNAVAIDGATSNTYNVVAVDVGTRLSVAVRAVNDFGEATVTSLPTELIVGAAPANVSLPTISGGSTPPKVGETLTASIGNWSGMPSPSFTYQWKGAGAVIVGAVQSTYRIAGSDVGKAITVTVTAVNSQGQASATSTATANVVADTAPIPVLSLFSVEPAPQFGEGVAALTVTTTAGNGIFWWVIVPDGATAPSAAQIKAGTDGSNNPAVSKGSIEVVSIETWGNNPTGLSAGTTYDAYGVMYNSTDQASNVVTDEFTMGGFAAPVLSTLVAADFSDIFAWFTVTTNNGSGTIYAVVVPELDAAPSAAQIKAGQNSASAAAPSANQAITTTGTKRLLVRGLTAATAYKAYFVQEVTAGFSNTPSAAFKADTLIKAWVVDGKTTDLSSSGTIFTQDQPDPFSGVTAIKWADNADGAGADPPPPAPPVFTTVSMSGAVTLFNGICKYHWNTKHEGGAAWTRVQPANITASGMVHCNVATGGIGAGTTPWIGTTSISLGGGWWQFSGAVNHAPPPDFTGTPDFVGSLIFYMGYQDGSAAVSIRDGTNIRYVHDIRITRITL